MANGTGTNIGLRPTQAVTEDFGGIVQQGVQGLIAKRERERLEQERKQQKQQEFEDRYGIEEDLYVLPDTEFRTVNDATTEALAGYRDRYYDVYKQLQKNPNDIELKKRLGNITNSVKRMRAAHEKFQSIGEKGLQMISEDKMSGVDEETWREQLEAFDEGRIKIRLDDKDNMQFMFYDKEGGLSQVVPYNEFIRGDLTERIDVPSEVEGMLKLIGRDKFDSNTGRFIETVDVWGNSQEIQARTLIRQNIQSDAVMADLLNQATNGESKKKSNFTEEERLKVENYLVGSIRNAYSEARSLRDRPYAPSGGSSRTPKGGANDPLSTDLIQPASIDEKPSITDDGRFQFTMAQPVSIDPTSKTSRRIDRIEATADGKIRLVGDVAEKTKDIPKGADQMTDEELFQQGGILRTISPSGGFTYYKRTKSVIDAEDNPDLINKLGNMFGVNDLDGLRNVLYNKFVKRFGQEEADRRFGGDLTPSTVPSNTDKDPLGLGI